MSNVEAPLNTPVWVNESRCKACDRCVSVCPAGVLGMRQDIHSTLGSMATVIHPEACIGCNDCELSCPDFAIFVADKKEYKDAVRYLEQAKNNDNVYANLALAFLYYKGDGVNKDIDKSFELLKESSDIDPNAAYQLARFYLQGINTKIDNQKGVELINFAASKGVSTAQKMLININREEIK